MNYDNIDDNKPMASNFTFRSWLKKVTKFQNDIRNSIYPARIESLWILVALVNGLHFADKTPRYGLTKYIAGFGVFDEATIGWQILICSFVAVIYWIARYALKCLLMYKGYMYENKRTGMSLTTKLRALLLKAVIKWNEPKLYSFQESLPRLPVPNLEDTIERYLQSMLPLLSESEQYRRVFNTFREPGIDKDNLIQFDQSDHVVLHHKGCYYKLTVYHRGRLLNPIELKHQIDQILNANPTTTDSEKNLASLTAMDRTKWAKTRLQYFSIGINRDSLHAIESSAFFMSLDDEPFGLSFDCPQENLDNQARMLLHGSGNNRWFGKSFNLVITSDAQFCLNLEHSWSDGPIIGHVYEEIMVEDYYALQDCYKDMIRIAYHS